MPEPEIPPSGEVAELDLRGLHCPMPVLRTRKALQRLRQGQRILVLCTDPLSSLDIPHLLAGTGDRLVARTQDAGILGFTIEKA